MYPKFARMLNHMYLGGKIYNSFIIQIRKYVECEISKIPIYNTNSPDSRFSKQYIKKQKLAFYALWHVDDTTATKLFLNNQYIAKYFKI